MFRKDFFKDKKVLVTGHTGFKGTWLSCMLNLLECKVYGYALEEKDTDSFYNMVQPKIQKSCFAFIQDKKKLLDFINEIKPEIIIHLASHSTLNQSMTLSDYIFETNVMGVVNLLEAVRQVNTVKAVLVVTSDKCYENQESGEKYKESARLGAQDPYSTSKACQELVTESYRKTFFSKSELNVSTATARASNVIGGGDRNLSRLFPYLLNAFSEDKVAKIRKPQAIRPWQNVLDVLGGYLTLTQMLYESSDEEIRSAYNFGPEDDGFVTVEKVVKILQDEFCNAKYIVTCNNKSVIETDILKLDNSKAKEILHWKPVFSFIDTVRMAAEYEKRIKNQSEREIVLDMIHRYFSKLDEEI